MLRFAPQLCVEHLPVLVPALMGLATMQRVTSDEDEEEGVDNEGIIENAFFALGMMCHTPVLRESSWGGVATSEVASLWLRALPFRADDTEARFASRQLCDAVEMGDALILGSDYENLSELLRVMAEVFQIQQEEERDQGQGGAMSVHPETLQRLRGILSQLQSGAVSPDSLRGAFSVLSPGHQEVLQGTSTA